MDTVFIRGLEIDCVIGVYEHEKIATQRIVFDLELAWDCKSACESDSLDDTLDYNAVCKRIERLCAETRFELVEALAEAVARCLMVEFDVPGLRLRLAKPQAIANTRDVGVLIHRGTAF